jgi:hypothetical protein
MAEPDQAAPAAADQQRAGRAGAQAGAAAPGAAATGYTPRQFDTPVQLFEGEWDEEGVWFYQAFNNTIADYAIKHQQLGGDDFNPHRMTWVKPSFAWVLYRSGYGRKHNQVRVLKLKIRHESLARLLSRCSCKHGGGGSKGRVQWDPARDIMSADGKEPRKMQRRRAIQIGLKAELSQLYVNSVVAIEDVTTLAHTVGDAHKSRSKEAMDALVPRLPVERPYMPPCSNDVLSNLAMMPGETAEWVAKIGLGEAFTKAK